jgi:hypothetical protein
MPETDEDADAFAWMAVVLGSLQERDPPGDPPATCVAHEKASRAGPAYGQAFQLLGSLRDCSHELTERGKHVVALPTAAMKVLQQAARGERVADQAELETVLQAGELLSQQLAMRVLTLSLQ